jgi:hypothetical protein
MERVYTFMLHDHVCDEFRLTNRFSVENGFRMFRDGLKYDNKTNALFVKTPENQLKRFSMVILISKF